MEDLKLGSSQEQNSMNSHHFRTVMKYDFVMRDLCKWNKTKHGDRNRQLYLHLRSRGFPENGCEVTINLASRAHESEE